MNGEMLEHYMSILEADLLKELSYRGRKAL